MADSELEGNALGGTDHFDVEEVPFATMEHQDRASETEDTPQEDSEAPAVQTEEVTSNSSRCRIYMPWQAPVPPEETSFVPSAPKGLVVASTEEMFILQDSKGRARELASELKKAQETKERVLADKGAAGKMQLCAASWLQSSARRMAVNELQQAVKIWNVNYMLTLAMRLSSAQFEELAKEAEEEVIRSQLPR